MRHRWIAVGICLVAIVVGLPIAIDHLEIEWPIQSALRQDARNEGIDIDFSTSWPLRSELTFDLRSVPDRVSRIDVFRTLWLSARELKDRHFEKVVLAYRGTPKFFLRGEYYRQIGEEYESQNPAFLVRTFPEHVFNPDGSPAFGSWTGGWLGVMNKQLEDANTFHDRWYLTDAGFAAWQTGK